MKLDWLRPAVLATTAILIASACGGSAAAQPTSAPSSAVTATLPPASTPATTATATKTAAPTVNATATTAATATAVATASSAATTAGGSLLAQGKIVWETAGGKGCQSCHGANGKGGIATDGSQAPNVTSATEQKLRDALRGGAALMTNLKLSDAEISAVLVYLAYLDQQ